MPKWLRKLDWVFVTFRWYRKWYGGLWELWWVDTPMCSEIWHNITHPEWERPTAICRGTVIKVENYLRK